MIIPVMINKIMFKVPDEILANVFSESVTTMKALKTLETVLKSDIEDLDRREQEQLDEILMLESDVSRKYLSMYVKGACAPTDVLARRAENASDNIDEISSMLELVVERYVAPSAEEVQTMLDIISIVLGELATFVYFAFSMSVTDDSIKEGNELAVTVPLSTYADDNNISPESVVDFVRGIMLSYKPSLSVLETMPELAEAFYDIVGSHIYDLEAVQDFISPEIVAAVVKRSYEGIGDVDESIKLVLDELAKLK